MISIVLGVPLVLSLLAGTVLGLRAKPVIGLVVGGLVVLSSWEVPESLALISAGGLKVYSTDLFAIVFMLTALLGARDGYRNLAGRGLALSILVLILGYSVLRGLYEHGLGTTINEARLVVYPAAVLGWTLTVDWSQASLRHLFNVWMRVLGWALVLLAIYHTARYGLGGANSFVQEAGVEQTGRPLVAVQALFLAYSAVEALSAWATKRSSKDGIAAVIFLAVVLLSQHRSVWIAVAIGVVALVTFTDSTSKGRLIIGGLLVLVITTTFGWVGGGYGSAGSEVSASISNDETYNARADGWTYLIGQSFDEGLHSTLLGEEFGEGWTRRESNGNVVQFQPHNWYVTLLLRSGIVGLAIVLAYIVGIVRRLRMQVLPLETAFVLTTLVYCWAYSLSWLACFFVGYVVVRSYRGLFSSGSASPSGRYVEVGDTGVSAIKDRGVIARLQPVVTTRAPHRRSMSPGEGWRECGK